MGTFSDRNRLISEANIGASVPHFAWVHGANFLSATKITLNPFHSAQINPESSIPIAPIRSIAPMDEPVKKIEAVDKPTKVKKKPSVKNLNQNLKPKQPKKNTSVSKKAKEQSMPEAKREKKNPNIVLDGTKFDFSGVPSPVCSCTGVPRVCYKWGAGGWQSSCCTISVSEYPLPMSSSRPGSRMAGRKMSNGAYGKLLLRLAAEGHDLTHPLDLKDHWARHGTNKFVTIK
ncbi:protein BASIC PENTACYSTEINE7 [Malania oleifera]|uniref:protein BASIC PENTACYSTEINE7 n=1 Tax=Malania oleifera TaxID=397392 RepID=UPI0025AE27FD|nr:protein BASIC PENTACYSTEINE7 [Malania oleifera]